MHDEYDHLRESSDEARRWAELHYAAEPAEPCWCQGPWRDVDPADRPELLAREHARGSSGCERAYAAQESER